jgi:hypothetical protein
VHGVNTDENACEQLHKKSKSNVYLSINNICFTNYLCKVCSGIVYVTQYVKIKVLCGNVLTVDTFD